MSKNYDLVRRVQQQRRTASEGNGHGDGDYDSSRFLNADGAIEPRTTQLAMGRVARRHIDAPAAADGPLAATLWRVIRKYKLLIFATTAASLLLIGTATMLMKPKYQAVSRVVFYREIPGDALGLKGMSTSGLGAEDADDRNAVQTQMGILNADALAMQVIQDLRLDTNPAFAGKGPKPNEEQLIETFHSNLDVAKSPDTRLIEIKFKSTDPKLAADVVNDLATAYVEQNYKSKFKSSMNISNWLSQQLTELQAKVEQSQQKLVDYQKENGLVGLDNTKNIVTDKLDDLNKELTAAQGDRIQKETAYRLAQSGQSELVAKLEPNPLVARLHEREAALNEQLANASVVFGPSHPKVRELKGQLQQVQESIKAENTRIGDHIRNDYEAAVRRERMLSGNLNQQKRAANEMSAASIQYNMLKRDYESNRQLYDGLLQKLKEAGVTATLKSSNIRIVDSARPPQKPISPNLPRALAFALLLGLGGGIGMAFVLDKWNDKVNTPEQVEILTPLMTLGVMPLFPTNGNGRARPALLKGGRDHPAPVCLGDFSPAQVEPYRALLSSVLLSAATPPRVILVTSPLPGEGKTTVSSNTAVLLARQQKRVLLVEADLRRPGIGAGLQLQEGPGLAALLRGECTFEEAAQESGAIPNLFVLKASTISVGEDADLLVSGFHELLAQWRTEFDHIVIDTPPVLAATDALRLSAYADSVLLVIRCGQTTKDAFLHAQTLLASVNANIAGVVLNGADFASPDFSRYSYGYGDTETPAA
jgi:capsular exopolysaccharide synthesis family protein